MVKVEVKSQRSKISGQSQGQGKNLNTTSGHHNTEQYQVTSINDE